MATITSRMAFLTSTNAPAVVRRLSQACANAIPAMLLLANSALAAADFVLGPGDKIAISVHARPDLSGEFRVLPAGYLSLPFVPNLPVAGRTLTEVKQAVVERFRDSAFLLDPRITIDIVEARPIFVAGDVRRPGSLPYQIGMTVLHAISAAGGLRALEIETLTAHLEVGRLREKLRLSQEATGHALIRRARLLAERAGQAEFNAAADVRSYLGEAKSRDAHESERTLLKQRADAHRSQLELLARQVALYGEEIEALNAHATAKTRESELVSEERRYIESLMQRGLTARTGRQLELQRIVVQIEGEKRQLATLVAKAKQEVVRVEQAKEGLISQRQIEITTVLKETEDGLANLKIAIEESQASLIEAREVLPVGGPLQPRSPSDLVIVRSQGEGTARIVAHADTPLLPGDLVDVPKR